MARFITLLFLTVVAIGEASAATTTPPPTVYEIEVIVFENRRPELEGDELWTTQEVRPLVDELREALVASPAALESPLTAAAEQLDKDGHYRVLAHRHWSQTAEAKSMAKPVRLNDASHQTDGTIRFYLSRFLHVDLNLIMADPSAGLFPDNPADYQGPVFWISAQRRVKAQELHYFDHPRFGALVRVNQAGKP